MEKIIKNLTQRIEELIKEIDEFEPKKTWDCKILQAKCEEKARLTHLLNLAQSGYVAPNLRKEIFWVVF